MKHLICIAKKYRYLMLLYLFMGFCRAFAQSFSSRYFQKIIDNFSSHSLKITHIAVYGSAIIALYVMSIFSNIRNVNWNFCLIKLMLRDSATRAQANAIIMRSIAR